jgi:nicotinamidase/pyrazinamidase
LQGTPNAVLQRDMDIAKVEVIIHKGFHPNIDSYATFLNRLRYCHGPGRLVATAQVPPPVPGRTGDRFFCCLVSQDAVRLGYDVIVVEDACRGIGISLDNGRTTMDDARERSHAIGVCIVTAGELTA